jgi:hypothetical protein
MMVLIQCSTLFRSGARHSSSHSQNVFSLPHRHVCGFPPTRLRHRCEIDIESQQILGHAHPDRMPTYFTNLFWG